MTDSIKNMYIKNKELILYLFFGGLTCVISFVSYFLFRLILDVSVSQILSWICAVSFAYVTNKIFVFESKRQTFVLLLKEIIMFFLARVFTGVVEYVLMVVFVKESTPKLTEMVIKALITVIVIVLNYIFSKTLVFARKK